METAKVKINEVGDYHCNPCDETVDAEDLGLVPFVLLDDDEDMENYWVRACLCPKCGSIQAITTTDPEVEAKSKEYIDALEDEAVGRLE